MKRSRSGLVLYRKVLTMRRMLGTVAAVLLASGLLAGPAHAEPDCRQLTSCNTGLSAPSAAPKRSGVNDSNYSYTVQEYLSWVVQDADAEWTTWFKKVGLREPDVGYRLVNQGEAPFVSKCKSPDGKIATAGHDFPNAFYCGSDSLTTGGKTYQGMIVLPVTTFQQMWLGNVFGNNSGVGGDFGAAGIVAHEFGHHIIDEIALQRSVPESGRPAGKNNELAADCLAGNWVASVYARQNLEDGDMKELVAALNTMGDPSVKTNSHGTVLERQDALRAGLSGNPFDCFKRYWPAIVK